MCFDWVLLWVLLAEIAWSKLTAFVGQINTLQLRVCKCASRVNSVKTVQQDCQQVLLALTLNICRLLLASDSMLKYNFCGADISPWDYYASCRFWWEGEGKSRVATCCKQIKVGARVAAVYLSCERVLIDLFPFLILLWAKHVSFGKAIKLLFIREHFAVGRKTGRTKVRGSSLLRWLMDECTTRL